jgi:hypothetical protein
VPDLARKRDHRISPPAAGTRHREGEGHLNKKKEKKIEVIRMKLGDLRLDFGNPRTITSEEMDSLKESLQRFDDFGVVVINEKDQVLAGNQRVAAMREIGWKKQILCKRLSGFSKAEQKEINIRANRSSGEFDSSALLQWIDEIRIAEVDVALAGFTEIQVEEFRDLAEEDDAENAYTFKIASPHYEPKNKKPNITLLIDKKKRDELVAGIDASDIAEEEKVFLREAAQRHLCFNYGLMADFYAHSRPEVQRFMEASALVIIDYKNAIEDGYVQIHKEFQEMQADDAE